MGDSNSTMNPSGGAEGRHRFTQPALHVKMSVRELWMKAHGYA